MHIPKVSVVIPTYNVEHFLTENLDAVLSQDFTDFELLISDNCSTDGTWKLIQAYAARDARIRCWQNTTNLGSIGNFNQCLQAAQGQYIKLLCADDKLLSPSALKKMAAQLDDHPEVALVSCASLIIDEQSKPLELRNYFGRSGIWPGRDIIIHCLEIPGNIIGEPTLIMCRREQCQHGFNPQFNQIADMEFGFHVLEQGDFAFLDEPLAAWRRRRGQETEVNRHAGRSTRDDLPLIRDWYAKPWLKARASRQLLFSQIRCLIKGQNEQAKPIITEMRQRLGKHWYAVYWIKRKINRPIAKLSRWLGKRRRQISAVK